MAPAIDETPAICRLNMAKSTAYPEWDTNELKGGYTVQPVPTPISTKLEVQSSKIEGIKSQNDRLFKRGKDISGLPINIGTNQLPYAPINTGITIKKIIINAWDVTITLYNCELLLKNWVPLFVSSHLIKIDSQSPINPEPMLKSRYNVPISLWFVEHVHLFIYAIFFCILSLLEKLTLTFWIPCNTCRC